MPGQTLVITADELNDTRNQSKAREAIDEGRPVRIVVTGPLAAVLSVAVANAVAESDTSSPADKKAALAEAKRKAKEKALAEAKRKSLKKSRLAAAKTKAKERALAEARKKAFAEASKTLRALDPAVWTVKSLADMEAKIVAATDDKALADALTAALTEAEKTLDNQGNDTGTTVAGVDDTGTMTIMVAGVDDAVVITIAVIVGVIAVLGFAALTTIALYAISKDYTATGENSGSGLGDLINFKFFFDLKPRED
jgi:hypothetical protein